jgi:hypothetical protein
VTYMAYTKTELDGFYRRMRAPARPQPVVEEYSPAVVHELTERESLLPGVRVMPALSGPAEPSKPSGLGDPRSRSVSVVCRLCHGDLDESLFCSLCGVVTLP